MADAVPSEFGDRLHAVEARLSLLERHVLRQDALLMDMQGEQRRNHAAAMEHIALVESKLDRVLAAVEAKT